MADILKNLSSFKECKMMINYSIPHLAILGFYYNSRAGLIQCSVCYFDITNSNLTIKEISIEHIKYAPKCRNGNIDEKQQTENKIAYDKAQSTINDIVRACDGNRFGKMSHRILSDDSGFASENKVLSSESSRNSSSRCKDGGAFEGKLLTYEFNPTGLSPTFLNAVRNVEKITDRKHQKTIRDLDQVDGTCSLVGTSAASFPNSASAAHVQNEKEEFDKTFHPARDKKTEIVDATYLIKFSKHPIMSCTEERRESFKGQEQKYKHCERASIEDFVTAGLFSVGPEDNVRCFFCDGGLRNVQSHNDPFLEHKRWFPNCKFVLFLENEPSVKKLQKDGTLVPDRTDPAHVVKLAAGFYFDIPGRALEAREVKARLETPVVQELMRQGYQREYLKRAIERRFMLHGDDYNSAHELIKDILDVEGDKALPRPGQTNNTNQATAQNSDATDGSSAAAAAGVPAVRAVTGQKLLGKGKDLLAAEAELPVNDEVKNMKSSEVLHTLKNTPILVPELRKLWDEYQEQSQVRTCKICLDREINTVFLPCGHYVTCDKCCPKISHCCTCRALIRGTVLALNALSEIK